MGSPGTCHQIIEKRPWFRQLLIPFAPNIWVGSPISLTSLRQSSLMPSWTDKVVCSVLIRDVCIDRCLSKHARCKIACFWCDVIVSCNSIIFLFQALILWLILVSTMSNCNMLNKKLFVMQIWFPLRHLFQMIYTAFSYWFYVGEKWLTTHAI